MGNRLIHSDGESVIDAVRRALGRAYLRSGAEQRRVPAEQVIAWMVTGAGAGLRRGSPQPQMAELVAVIASLSQEPGRSLDHVL